MVRVEPLLLFFLFSENLYSQRDRTIWLHFVAITLIPNLLSYTMQQSKEVIIPRAILESRRENIALGYGGKLSRNQMIGLKIAIREKHASAIDMRIPWHPRSAQLEYEAQLRKKANKHASSSA
jgi:hypothetical protein